MPLALAASFLITVGAVGMLWKQSSQWDSIEACLADQGLRTIIFMPKTAVTDGEIIEFGQMHAFLVSLEYGPVAII